MHSAPELASQIEMLRSPPQVYLRLRALLDEPRLALEQLAQVLASDPALTASVLRMANSALYGFRGKVDSVLSALQLLGVERVHGLVLAAAVEDSFGGVRPPGVDVQAFWHNSLHRALWARALAAQVGEDADRMMIAGLLADIGHLVMAATVPLLAARARAEAQVSGEPLHLAERRVVGCDFAETGAALMSQWGVPQVFAALIGCQTLPRLAGSQRAAAAVLELSSCLVTGGAPGELPEAGLPLSDCAAIAARGPLRALGEQELLQLGVEVDEELQRWLATFRLAQPA